MIVFKQSEYNVFTITRPHPLHHYCENTYFTDHSDLVDQPRGNLYTWRKSVEMICVICTVI